jgi:sugar lactone lactonase YvrE
MLIFSRFRLAKGAVLGVSTLAAAMVAVPSALAQTIVDAQVPFSFTTLTLKSPSGIAVAPDGTVYVADPRTGVVRISATTGTVSGLAGEAASLASTATLLTPSIALTAPTAVAVDSTGALYIGDSTAGLVIKMATPETSSAATAITYPGTETPTALAVDSSNNLYIADETQEAIYKDVSGSVTKLSITLPKTKGKTPALQPLGLAANATGDVYFANDNNVVYEYTASKAKTAVFLDTPGAGDWDFSGATTSPIGMGFDPAGNLYVMDGGSKNLIEITSTTNVRLPLSASVSPTGLAVSSIGNLYISDDTANTADEVYFNNNPFNFGSVPAGTNSPAVTVNFYFTSNQTAIATYQSMQGDATGEFKTSSSLCSGNQGSVCSMAFYVDYLSTLPGTRIGAVGVTDNAGTILAVPNIGIDVASALALYPGTQATLSQTTQTLYEPEGLAVTGDGKTFFVADEGGVLSGGTYTYNHGAVWAYPATGGTPNGPPTSVGTFPTPVAVALDAQGDLFVADYSGTVTEIPVSYSATNGSTWPSTFGTPLSLTGSVALNHPMSLAFDPSGNLYIGDMGPAGINATASTPGYIIKVPANGGPATKLLYTVGGVPIVFPQSLAADSQGNLYIADGGDGVTDAGGVDVVTAETGTASAISFGSFGQLSQPSGLGFDAANDLYVLDGYNQRVLVVPIDYSGTVPTADSGDITLLGQGLTGLTSALVTPSNMVVWQGGQNISFSDLGYQPPSGTSSPIQVLTLQSQNATVNATSGSSSVTGVNVGNEEITFAAPGLGANTAFTLSGCGSSSGTTLATGIVPNCTATVTYNGSGTSAQSNIFTLNGNAGLDGSALGNKIFVSAAPATPLGVFTGSGEQSSPFGTVTLTNQGSQPLTVTAISVTAGIVGTAQITGGSCTLLPSLGQNQSCTINFTLIDLLFGSGEAFINVTDNNLGVVGTVQSTTVFTLFSGLVSADIPRNMLDRSNATDLTSPTGLNSSNNSNSSNDQHNKKTKKNLHP